MSKVKNFFKSVGRFLLSILPAFLFFTSLLFTYSMPVFASSSGGEIVEYKPEVSSPTLSKEAKQSIIDAALDWYFPNLIEYERTCAKSTLSAATKLYEKYSNGNMSLYEYYLDNVCLGMRSLIGTTSAFPAYTGWKTVNDVILRLDEKFVGTDIDWDQVSTDVALKAVQDFIDPTTQQIKKVERAVTGEDVTLPADILNDAIPSLNKQYFPKNATGKMSYRTDERWHNKFDSQIQYPQYYGDMDFYSGSWGFAPVGGGDEMYIIFYLQNGADNYYSPYQFHFKIDKTDVWYEDRDEVEYTGYTLTCDFWDMIDGSADNPTSLTLFDKSKCSFISLRPSPYTSSSYLTLAGYPTYDSYINNLMGLSTGMESADFSNISVRERFYLGYSSDLSQSINFYSLFSKHFKGSLESHDSTCTDYGSNHDIGYVASASPISTIYNIDVSKVPDDYVITVKGDTIYDYSITNPVTGDTTTIDKFVVNNYNFPAGGNQGGNQGGTTSGNVTVSGQIDVSGTVSVDVDVDVNINGNGGGGGNNYEMPDTSFFDDYLDDALEESSGIRKFISDFFDSVPGEITKLICTGLVLAILCRLIGR